MKKVLAKILIIVLMVLLISTAVFAKGKKSSSNWYDYFKSFHKDGDFNFYASIGYWWGITLNAGADLILGEWKIANVFPLDFGIGGRFLFQTWGYTYYTYTYSSTYWGAAPMFIVHWGYKDFNLDFYEGAGLGFFGYSSTSTYEYDWPSFGIGFAAVSGITWYFSKNMGLILEYSYIGYTSTYGVGITFKF